MSDSEIVVGIDLGTTNSEVSAFKDGRVRVLGPGKQRILPSCVGISPSGELLVGEAARNQQLVYPERTVRSIKRKMGSNETVKLGDRSFTPPEISALILRELAAWAKNALGREVRKAVITVPAYFSDAQRSATREAGALAGLDVIRILNEPTAASLAYGSDDNRERTLMVYDLGGGTFDVSIVKTQGEITEVLASHGNNMLGGDDFNQLLLDRLLDDFRKQHAIDLRDGHPVAYARMWWAVEAAKKTLSAAPYAMVREEALVTANGKPLHFEREIARAEYEELIRPLVESTLDSVTRAMTDAGISSSQLDEILLVGGSTRTPLIARVLEERAERRPRGDVHPDLCVSLGAGVLASRLAGHEVDRVLVDITPYTFGTSYLGERGGVPYPHCFKAIIERNTPLPVTRTERFYTSYDYQEAAEVCVYQGDDEDALKNIPVGRFLVEGLTTGTEPNEILCRMQLDIDGILKVTATEKKTGKSKHITIDRALQPKTKDEIAEARARLGRLHESRRHLLEELFASRSEACDDEDDDSVSVGLSDDGEAAGQTNDTIAADAEPSSDPEWEREAVAAKVLLERAEAAVAGMHEDDRAEALDLRRKIEAALGNRDRQALAPAVKELTELLFFVEGK